MQKRHPQRITPALRRRLALAGFIGGGVLAVLVNQGTPGQASEPAQAVAANLGPVELGRVDWLRDYDEGVTQAQQTGKPMLLLFQEVPG